MIGSWVCLACPDHGSGAVTKVEQASRLHTKKAGHATATALGGATGVLAALQGGRVGRDADSGPSTGVCGAAEPMNVRTDPQDLRASGKRTGEATR